MNDMNDFPIVPLAGSESWSSGYDFGRALDKRFPNEDAVDFAICCEYNGGEDLSSGIVLFECEQQGDNDGDSWVWALTLGNGDRWLVTGWCDYSGWDCRSGSDWVRRP